MCSRFFFILCFRMEFDAMHCKAIICCQIFRISLLLLFFIISQKFLTNSTPQIFDSFSISTAEKGGCGMIRVTCHGPNGSNFLKQIQAHHLKNNSPKQTKDLNEFFLYTN